MIAKSTKPAASGASSSRNTGRKTVSVSNRVKNNASYTFPSGYANRDCRSIYLFACLLCDLPISDEDDKLQLADRLAEKFHEYFEYRPERLGRRLKRLDSKDRALIDAFAESTEHSLALMYALGAILCKSPKAIHEYWISRKYHVSSLSDRLRKQLDQQLKSLAERKNSLDEDTASAMTMLQLFVQKQADQLSVWERDFDDPKYAPLWDRHVQPPFPFEHDDSINPEHLPILEAINTVLYNEEAAQPNPDAVVSCDCGPGQDCGSNKNCLCRQMMDECPFDKLKRLRRIANDSERTAIYQCHSQCTCSPKCRLRSIALSRGNTRNLELFNYPGKGLGVRTREKIYKGSFIVEYVGERITHGLSRIRSEVYMKFDLLYSFQLDFHLEEDAEPDREIDEIDAVYYCNISRFFNHSCDGGNMKQLTFFEDQTDQSMQRIGFFATKDILPGEELTFDYNIQTIVGCCCGTIKCRNPRSSSSSSK